MSTAVTAAPSRPLPRVDDARAPETRAAEKAKPAPEQDWTARISDPGVRDDARRRHGAGVENPSAAALKKQNERAESDAIGGKGAPGKVVPLGGDPRKGTTLSVHGINASPGAVAPLTEPAKKGSASATFAYDDKARSLDASADDFRRGVTDILAKNPNAPLTINAHSMGSRVAVVGLDRMRKDGSLKGRDVTLNLVAPPLAGFKSANSIPDAATKLMPSLKSSVDMGSSSAFQREIENAKLDGVTVRVYGGTADKVAVPDAKWRAIAEQLTGDPRRVAVLPANHDSLVDVAAADLRRR